MKIPKQGQRSEVLARRAIEDQGFVVHDANVILQSNCPNVDLIVYAKASPIYVQVKSSEKPAGKDCVVVDGSPWTGKQLFDETPVFNKHSHYVASLVILVDKRRDGTVAFYVAPPGELEKLVRSRARDWAAKPKRDGGQRSIAFRKELPRDALKPWLEAWHLLGAGFSSAE